MVHRLITIVSVVVALVSLSLWAADKHSGHTGDMQHNAMSHENGQPLEGGQAAFAALIEIVAMLEQDAETDWDSVDIDGLRSHLVDMNHLILDTAAKTSITGDGQIRFDVRGSPASIESIHRMVPAHSRFIAQSRGWTIEHQISEVGATITISAIEETQMSRIQALGFYGFMSLDSHHQAHHYQMAIGHSH
ncbi:MAG: hypothetical protein KTR35_02475 [Gammaproteobacteria bacterium]|nr:hypothetical protein [Gammaproteobacteria bacterium]